MKTLLSLFLLLAVGASAATGIKISEYPNTPVLTNSELFIVAVTNVTPATNRNISYGQLRSLLSSNNFVGSFTGDGRNVSNVVAAYASTATNIADPLLFGPSGFNGGFVLSKKNPPSIFAHAIELSFLLDGSRVDCWYRDTSGSYALKYAYSDDPLCETWTVGNGGVALSVTSPDVTNCFFPYVFKVGTTYYLVGEKGGTDAANGDGSLHLWSSADKVTWAYANGGNPIFTNSTTTSAWDYKIFNPAIAVVGNTWHLLLDGLPSGSPAFQLGYATSSLAEGPNFNLHKSTGGVISSDSRITNNVGCTHLMYITNRGALMTIHADESDGVQWVLRSSYGFITNDLSNPANWHQAPGFGLKTDGIHLTDATLVFATNKPWKSLLGYCYNQDPSYLAYGGLSQDDFFDSVVNPASAFDYARVQTVGRMDSDMIDVGHRNARLSLDSNQNLVISNGANKTIIIPNTINSLTATNLTILGSGATKPFSIGGTELVFTNGLLAIGHDVPAAQVDISGVGGSSLILRDTAEILNRTETINFLAGPGALSSANAVAQIYSQIMQADPSTLKGDLIFRVNIGDTVRETLRLLNTQLVQIDQGITFSGSGLATITDATANGITDVLTLRHNAPSGAIGLGSGIRFQGTNAFYGGITDLGGISSYFQDVGSIHGKMDISTMYNNTYATRVRISGTGNVDVLSGNISASGAVIATNAFVMPPVSAGPDWCTNGLACMWNSNNNGQATIYLRTSAVGATTFADKLVAP